MTNKSGAGVARPRRGLPEGGVEVNVTVDRRAAEGCEVGESEGNTCHRGTFNIEQGASEVTAHSGTQTWLAGQACSWRDGALDGR